MTHFSKDLGSSKDMISFNFKTISKQDLYKKVEEILLNRNYKKIKNTNGNSTYESGNRITRILLGAFVKYFKFHVIINDIDDDTQELRIVRATSGMSGGLIGMNQVTKEMTLLAMEFKKI